MSNMETVMVHEPQIEETKDCCGVAFGQIDVLQWCNLLLKLIGATASVSKTTVQ